MSTETHTMVLTRVFDAPLEQVWNAWGDSQVVKQWWGPTGFTCPVADMNFHVGGTSLICMRAPAEFGGQDMYNTWTYTKIVPMQEMEFLQHFTDKDGNHLNPSSIGLPAGIPEEVPHRVTFKALNDRQTEITMTECGYASEQVVQMSQMGMEQCLDKMAATFRA